MEKLRRVYLAAARFIGGGWFRKFDHISQYMRAVLHWLPFPQHISYRIASLVWRCLPGWAPSYLCKLCMPPSLFMCRPSYIRPLCDNVTGVERITNMKILGVTVSDNLSAESHITDVLSRALALYMRSDRAGCQQLRYTK